MFAGVSSPDGASHQPRGQAPDQEHRLPQRQGQLLFCCSKGLGHVIEFRYLDKN